jgi:hypothetical protein
MTNQMYDELALERTLKERFGLELDLGKVILNHVPVSHTATATLFLTPKKQLYLYVEGKSKILLGDVRKIVSRMGLKAELFLPPKGRPQYFDEIALSKFHDVFPGRSHVTSEDLIFYRTLAPYNPALIIISEVKNGEIYQFDTDSSSDWRIATKFTYRRILTS